MDKFTGKRRETWQSKTPVWPFMVVGTVVVVITCALISVFWSGAMMGDGTGAGRMVVIMNAFANVFVPAVIVGGAVGLFLNYIYFTPANKGALKWTGLLILAGAIAAVPASLPKAITADRMGYAIRLNTSVAEAREAAKRSEADLQRRLFLLLRNNPFDAQKLSRAGGLENAAKIINAHRALITSARQDYDKGQAEARAAMEKGIVGRNDREAVLQRMDEAASPRKAIMERVWKGHERIADLREQELTALRDNRGSWRATYQGAAITSPALFNRIQQIENDIREAIEDVEQAEADLYRHDAETEAGIDRVLRAAV